MIDFADPAFVADPYPALAGARAQSPVIWHEGLGEFLALSHATSSAVLRDRRLGRIFAPREPANEWETFNWLHADSILDSEPPKHTRLRSLVASAFGRGHVARMTPAINTAVARLLQDVDDRLGQNGEVDLIAELAEPLPVLVIADLLDVPESQRHQLRPWSQAIVRMYEVAPTAAEQAAAQRASAEFAGLVAELAADRARRPGPDLLTDLVQARDGADRLSTHELIATAVLLLNAGHEASVNGFGNGLHSLLTSEAGRGDLSLLDPVPLVEEMLRHDSPLQFFERTATAATEIAGVRLEPGQKIAALLGAANRDPAVFTEPDRFDPTRTPNPHLAFGLGIHFCLGAPLARLELTTSVAALTRRYPRLSLVDAQVRPTFVLKGFERLVVSVD